MFSIKRHENDKNKSLLATQDEERQPAGHTAAPRLPSWSPEEILDELHGLSTPNKLSGQKLLLEVGGVDRGWMMDFTTKEAIVSRYNIPGFNVKSNKKPSGPPLTELKSLPWVWYKDRKLFSKIETGKMSDMTAFVTGRIAMSGDSSPWDNIESIWIEAKEKAKERKEKFQATGGLMELPALGEDIDDEDDDDDAIDEEARIIATFKPSVEPTDPRTRAFWVRHLGTDMLVASYLYLLSSIFYMFLCLHMLSMSLSNADAVDPSKVAHGIANSFGAILFALASVYFIKLSYPETTMIMAYRAMTKDPNTMAFIERYFTANEMLVALWIITGAVVIPIFLVAVYEAIVLHELKRAIIDILTISAALPLLGVFNVSVMPDAMRANNGLGSSFFFDGFWAPMLGLKGGIVNEDRVIFWKKHLGSDFLAGAWIFAVLGVLSGVAVVPWVVISPRSAMAWLTFWSSIPFSVGSLLMLRGSYPEHMNSSLFFSTDESAAEPEENGSSDTGRESWEETPLLALV